MQVNKTSYEKNQILYTHNSHTVTTTHTAETALNPKHAFIHLMTYTFIYIYINIFINIYIDKIFYV